MKKMIAMLCAIATGFFAFGDAEVNTPAFRFSGVNFEEAQGYHAGDLITDTTRETGVDGYYWFLEDNADDESGTVKAVEIEEGETNQYLEVETGAVPLYRTVADWEAAASKKTVADLDAVDIDTGIFFDADVKFTPGAEAPTLAEGAKFAVWALETEPETEGDPMTTNLMVTAGKWTEDGIVPVTFTLATPANFDFSAWHRLTIRAIKEVTTSPDNKLSGFVVFIDGSGEEGTPVAAVTADYADKIGIDSTLLTTGAKKYYDARQLFLSASASGEDANQQLKVIGLQGSGAIDNFQITDYANSPAFARGLVQVPISFTAADVTGFNIYADDNLVPDTKIDKTAAGVWVATVDGTTEAIVVSDIVVATGKMVTNYDDGEEYITFKDLDQGGKIVTETIGFVVDGVNYPAGETGFAEALEAAQGGVPLTLKADFTWENDQHDDNAGVVINDEIIIVIDLNGNDIVFNGEKAAGAYTDAFGFYAVGSLTILDSLGGGSVKTAGTFAAPLVLMEDGGTFTLGADSGDLGATIDGKINDAGFTTEVTLYKGFVNSTDNPDVSGWLAEDHEAGEGADTHAGFWEIKLLGAVTLELVADTNADITSDPVAGTIAKSTPVTVTATPNAGYKYDPTPDGWEAGANGTVVSNFTITADTTITAPAPTQIEYTLTLNAGANTTLTADKTAPYHYNDVVVITATPNQGCEFTTLPDGWFAAENGAATNTVTITANTTITGPAAVQSKTGFAIIIVDSGTGAATTNYYPTLAAAIAAAGTGEPALPSTVTLLEDCELDARVTISGKTVTLAADKAVTVSCANDRVLYILNNANVTIGENVTLSSPANPTVMIMGVQVKTDAGDSITSKLTVNGTIVNTNPTFDKAYAVCGNGLDSDGVEITVGATGVVSNQNGTAIYFPMPGALTVNGTVTGYSAIIAKDGTITINNGAVVSATGTNYQALPRNTDGSTPTGDAIVGGYYPASMKYGIPMIVVNGGTITAVAEGAAGVNAYDHQSAVAPATSEGNVAVQGGTFNKPVAEGYCANGYIPQDNDDGTYGVKEGFYVARVNGEQGYETLAEAFTAVEDGETIELLTNVTLSAYTLEKSNVAGTGITLDLGDYTLTLANGSDLKVKATKLTITNGEIVCNGGGALNCVMASDVTIADDAEVTGAGYVQISNGTVFTVNGSVETKTVGVLSADGENPCTITVNEGATIDGGENEAVGVQLAAADTLNLNGGTIKSGVVISGGNGATLNLTAGVVDGLLEKCVGQLTAANCGAYFSEAAVNPTFGYLPLADLCAEGYEPQVVGGTGEYKNYYQIGIKKFNVTFKAEGATDIVSNDVAYGTAFADVKPADPTAPTGKSFKGWTPVEATIVSNSTFTAEFDDLVYDITFTDAGEWTNVVKTTHGQMPEAPTAPAVTGRTFKEWDPTIAAATAPATYTTVYTANVYYVTFYTNTVEAAKVYYSYGDDSIVYPTIEGVTAWSNEAFTAEFEFNGNTANNDQKAYATIETKPDYPEYIDPTDTDLAAEYNAWKAKYGADTESTNEEAFLLDCDPKNVETEKAKFKFTEITVDSAGNVTFKIATKTPAGDKLAGYNGYLVIKGKADLTTGEWAPKKAGDKFFQATLTTVKPVKQ